MTKKHISALCLVVICAACTVLYFFNPVGSVWMPKCAFYTLTGLKCPGCGGLRAMHSAMHLHFAEALAYNPVLPVMAAIAAVIIAADLKGNLLSQKNKHRIVYAYLVVFVLWWIIRNIIGV